MQRSILLAAAMAGGLASSAMAVVPSVYRFQLQTRGNLAANPSGTFNVPTGTTFNSTTVSLNSSGAVASKISLIGTSSNQGIFYGVDGAGGVVATRSDIDTELVSDVTLGNSGRIVVPISFNNQPGIYFRDTNSPAGVSFLTTGLPGGSSYSGLRLTNSNIVGGRTNVNGNSLFSYDPATGTSATHASQTGNGFSFIYTPTMNNSRIIAARVTPSAGTSSTEELRTFTASGASTLIATEGVTSVLGLGVLTAIDNPSINDAGLLSFQATAGSTRGVFRTNADGSISTIATVAAGGAVTAIDFFAVQINSSGNVAFRGRDTLGNDAIFVGDGTNLVRVIGEADVITTDVGLAQLGQETANIPTFSGGIGLNDSNQVAFTTGLYPVGDRSVEYGTGIYVATAVVPEPTTLAMITAGGLSLLRRRWN